MSWCQLLPTITPASVTPAAIKLREVFTSENDPALIKTAIAVMLVAVDVTLYHQVDFYHFAAIHLGYATVLGLMILEGPLPASAKNKNIHRAPSTPVLDKVAALAMITLCEVGMYYFLPFNQFAAATALAFGASILAPAFPKQTQ